jgi:predicted nucleic acid-binding protein
MRSVYLETTIPSYLSAKPSRDLIVSAHQQISHEWWDNAKDRFRFLISEAVLEEIRAGDPEAAQKRLAMVSGVEILELTDDVQELVHIYEKGLGLPSQASVDLIHIAFTVAYEIDYLVTWNCKHIANGEVIKKLQRINHRLDRFTPIILTPEELQEPSGEKNA